LEVDGEKITQDKTLADILAQKKTDQEIELLVLRGKEKIKLKVKLKEKE
jgi:S1-C subfamily serine protease